MKANIPETSQPRVVVVGAGFGGLEFAEKLSRRDVQVVLIDKNNYHQFQPLFYQVAMAGLEPSSISFPLRKVFQNRKNIHIRMATALEVNTSEKYLTTTLGRVNYDYLVLALGADTNFYGMQNIARYSLPMKSVTEAIALRNRVLQNFEDAISITDDEERLGIMSLVIVGGGPTGVEVAGTLAEMKRMILPKDFPELNFDLMQIYLVQSSGEILDVMSDEASVKGKEYLEQLGVIVRLNERITDFDGRHAFTSNGDKIRTNNLVWAAGIVSNRLQGFPDEVYARNGRMLVNEVNQVKGFSEIFAIGDMAQMVTADFPMGHPQVAQPAIQQGSLLSKNIFRMMRGESMEAFRYKDLGSMATIGRKLAVVDLPYWKFQGAFAWFVWMFVHLFSILGVKNKILVFINWVWNYFTYDQSLRLILRPKSKAAEPLATDSPKQSTL